MFTGIIEELGTIQNIGKSSITISCKIILEDIHIGDSISVDGVCLTVVSFDKNSFSADVSPETMRVTKLGDLKNNNIVNLERAMLATSRFGGHIVSGHIDEVVQILNLSKNNNFYDLEIKTSGKYVVKKGSIAIDGISLTVADVTDTSVKVAVIPHTFESTNLKSLSVGDNVNVEYDILAKYVEKNLLVKDNKSNITEDFLKSNGFM